MMRPMGYIVLTITLEKDGDEWVARCEELGTSIQASGFDEATAAIREAVTLHLNALEEEHERERFFRENNIRIYSHRPETIRTEEEPVMENLYINRMVQPLEAVSAPC